MTKRHLTIASRESPLALQQTEWVKKELERLYPHISITILGMTTYADKQLNMSLEAMGGKSAFVKELEDALLNHKADIAVHSMKDVPMDLPPGLIVPVICKRKDPRDVLVSLNYKNLAELPAGRLLGTSSLRRRTQLHALRPDLLTKSVRGNVNTRLEKLAKGEFDALILAAAGLERLDLGAKISAFFSTDEILPAAGQGALGIECREEDEAIKALIAPLIDTKTAAAVTAERAVCRALGGGCTAPVAAYAEVKKDQLWLRALVASPTGRQIIRAELNDVLNHAQAMGERVAAVLKERGAEKILAELK